MPGNATAGDIHGAFAEGLGVVKDGVLVAAERLNLFASDPFKLTHEADAEDRAVVEVLLPRIRQVQAQLMEHVRAAERQVAGSRHAVFDLTEGAMSGSSRRRAWDRRRANSMRQQRIQAEKLEAELRLLSEGLNVISTQRAVLRPIFDQAEEQVDALLPAISGSNRHERLQVQLALARHAIYQDFLDSVREHLVQLTRATRKLQLIAQELILLRMAISEASELVLHDQLLFKTWVERARRGMLSASSLARRRAALG